MNSPSSKPTLGVLGIIRRDERLILIQRAEHVPAPLAWCFPGGHIEPGETQQQALVREIREEINLEVEPGEKLMTQTKRGGNLVLHCWSATIVSGEARPNPDEVADLRWMTPQEVRTLEGVLPGTTEILDRIGL